MKNCRRIYGRNLNGGWPTAGDPRIHDLRRLFEEELHEEIILEAEMWDEIWNSCKYSFLY